MDFKTSCDFTRVLVMICAVVCSSAALLAAANPFGVA